MRSFGAVGFRQYDTTATLAGFSPPDSDGRQRVYPDAVCPRCREPLGQVPLRMP